MTVLSSKDCPLNNHTVNEPPHDKTNKMACVPSEDSDQSGNPPCLIRVFAQWVAKDPSFLHVDSEDSDQTGRMLSLHWAHMPFCWFCHEAAQITGQGIY